ncbi:hypothetical protein MKW94_011357 [Papaver nudicaule]|uniref:Nop domain-containing protein n=1 Tax=Papaver nudicaule TaxID=74823 RepID=A0AA41VSB5_PAPNU|nr:hypothetical protein [Papaver nudicaule]
MEPMRGIIGRLTEYFSGLGVQDSAPMSLVLSGRPSRPTEKADTSKIIEAIILLDDLDKELNNSAKRVGQLYNHHFPELANVVSDSILYAKVVKLMGNRTNAATLDFSEVLPNEIETHLKAAAVMSMGSELNELDFNNIHGLCDQVLSLSESRVPLYDDLKIKMNTIAPNLTALVGELVGARLIAKAGGLLNLAKKSGRTIQILGAEKASLRARKTKCAGPKHGFIFNASLIGVATSPKVKGRMARSLGAKIALAVRCDAYGDTQDNTVGLESGAKLEARLRRLEATELADSAENPISRCRSRKSKNARWRKKKAARNKVGKLEIA